MRCACLMCGYIYVPAAGDPDNGILPGTEGEALPPEWVCPNCKATQDDFAMMEDDD